METVHVFLDAKLLIRHALQQHIKRLRELELEERDWREYLAKPQREQDFRIWEDAAAWPES